MSVSELDRAQRYDGRKRAAKLKLCRTVLVQQARLGQTPAAGLFASAELTLDALHREKI